MSGRMKALKALLAPGPLLRLGLAIAAAIAIWIGLDMWIDGRSSIEVFAGGKPVELLAPSWLHLVAVVPAFFVIRILSLTDLSILQQVVQATLRCGLLVHRFCKLDGA